ncbi:HAD-like domain-containing protein [Penicillium subrubescens]|uniref:2-haloalkanoic acid dehalogenase n=1 Tax=Penicillium subrubescens TaxID=1316194 RepID=A0A1Q5T0S7_9EURO|nr:HAD-like domain-containing protein [Penicillium subrubescens]KAJ5911400.1 HAD-like domain-containing protein [Penicillium subrubescens]OKO93869.1 2-haloalkanoic acid dehalogenase [Penicillium subrubescens]
MAGKTVVALDLYGTLLSTESIANQLASHFEATKAQAISALWRRYQLEYTWRLNSMERYEDFSSVTRNALLHALAESEEQLSDSKIANLMEAYDSLSIFPDVNPALGRIAADPTIHAVVFSNGSRSMVSNSILRSRNLAPHASVFQDLITVDDVQRYKPSRASYQHLAEKVGKQPSEINELWLISGNPFDVVGARSMGMNAIWVDRAGKGWQDAAVPNLRPSAIVRSLEHIVDTIKGRRE